MTSAANSRGVERLVILFTAAWAIVLAAACAFHNGRFFHDDAYITLRYARHLIEGFGPVWNTAGPRVEGFSSPLHMLLIAGLGALHIPLTAAARAINFTFHIILIAGVWLSLRRSSGIFAATLGAALVTALWPLIIWDFGGLDAVPFAALVTLGTLLSLRYFEHAEPRVLLTGGLTLGLAIFMRAEAAAPALTIFVCAALFAPAPAATRLRHAALAALCCLAIALPWEIFRLTYYHAALPNTFYAKVYGIPRAFLFDRGWKYWKAAAHDAPFIPVLSVLTFAAAAMLRKLTRSDVVLFAVIVISAVSIYITGGDYMIAYRTLCGVLSMMAVLLVRMLTAFGLFTKPSISIAVSAIFALLAALQFRGFEINPHFREPAALVGETEGRLLANQWPAGATVAINFAGSIPYFADNYTYIDELGLNDRAIGRRAPMPIGPIGGPTTRRIGHLKGDGVYVLSRNPDIIFLGGGVLPGTRYDVMLYGDWELLHDPRFAAYKPCRIPVTFPPAAYAQLKPIGYVQSIALFVYQRRDLPWPCDPPTAADWTSWGSTPPPTDISQNQPQGNVN